MSEQPLPEEPECLCGRDPSGLRADIVCPVHDGDGSIERPMRERIDALARVIGPVLRRLYPQNPDLVLGREARHIAAALLESDAVLAVMAETRESESAPLARMVNRAHDEIERLAAERDALQAEVERLKTAILDIDAHAVPRSTDEHGFNAGGYVISIGSLHRALGLIGHAAAECSPEYPCGNCSERAVLVGIIRHLRDDLIPCSSHDEGWRWYMPDYDGNCVVAGSEPMTPAEAEFFTQEGKG